MSMPLTELAEREYAMLNSKDDGKNTKPKIPNAGDFDFLTSDESTPPVPIHVLEISREERRRRDHVDRNTSKQEFAAALGIDLDDTRDPDSGHSVLEVSEAVRAYFGDPEDEAYRTFRSHMARVATDLDFLKRNTFVDSSLRAEYEAMRAARERMTAAHEGGGPDAALARQAMESQYSRAHQETLRRYRESRQGQGV